MKRHWQTPRQSSCALSTHFLHQFGLCPLWTPPSSVGFSLFLTPVSSSWLCYMPTSIAQYSSEVGLIVITVTGLYQLTTGAPSVRVFFFFAWLMFQKFLFTPPLYDLQPVCSWSLHHSPSQDHHHILRGRSIREGGHGCFEWAKCVITCTPPRTFLNLAALRSILVSERKFYTHIHIIPWCLVSWLCSFSDDSLCYITGGDHVSGN